MGKLIALEGIDGSGKSTIAPELIKKLNLAGISSKLINKKKTDYDDARIKKYAESIKSLIWYDDNDPYYFVTEQGWLYFHALWYSILLENEILPNLDKFDVLIVDGWFYKMYSRFLLKEKFNLHLLSVVYDSIKKCDEVFILDTLPETTWSRGRKFNLTEIGGYDNIVLNPKVGYIEYQMKVREKLLKLALKENWNIIDSDRLDVDSVVNIIFYILEKQIQVV